MMSQKTASQLLSVGLGIATLILTAKEHLKVVIILVIAITLVALYELIMGIREERLEKATRPDKKEDRS